MSQLKDFLKTQINLFTTMRERVLQALSQAPRGKLRISCSRNRVQYYHRKEASDITGTYLSGEDAALIRSLAQKDYDEKALKLIDLTISAYEKCLAVLPEKSLQDICAKMPPHRRKLIEPLVESDEEYARRWQQETYEHKEISEDTPVFITNRNEKVRSKSEMLIANDLDYQEAQYHYEKPLMLEGFGLVHPDFTVLNVRRRREYVWEHFGSMDKPDYVERNMKKLNAYFLNGYIPGVNFIMTLETKDAPLDMRIVREFIRRFIFG